MTELPTSAPRRTSWLNRTVVGIGLASLCSDLSHETITALLPAFLASLGASAAALGIVEGVSDGLSTAAKLYGGWLADRLRRRKPLCAVGYGVMALSPITIAAATHWVVVLGGRGLAWLARGLRSPARKAIMADAVSPETRGRAFGFERAMDTTGAVIAPLAVLALVQLGWHQRSVILLAAIPALLAVLAIVVPVRERTDRVPIRTPFAQSFGGLGGPFKEFLIAAGLFGLGDFADTFFILYAVTVLTGPMGVTAATAASVGLYAVHNVFYAACAFLGGWVSDHVNKPVVLACGYAAAASATLCMVLGVRSLPGLALMFALAGAGVGVYEAVEDAIAADLLPATQRGSGFGVLAVVTGLGDLLSSLAFGCLWAAWGTAPASVLAVVPMVGGVALALHLAWKPSHSG